MIFCWYPKSTRKKWKPPKSTLNSQKYTKKRLNPPKVPFPLLINTSVLRMGDLEIEIFTAVASFQNTEKNTDAPELIAGIRFWIFNSLKSLGRGEFLGGFVRSD